MLVWVVGAGGLLGSSVTKAAASDGSYLFDQTPVPWTDDEAAGSALAANLDTFLAAAGRGTWAIAWCAGSSIVASTLDETEREMRLLGDFVEDLAHRTALGEGAFFLASSAGGVYAGSTQPPFTVDTVPSPISPYGQLKLRQEGATISTLAGRIPVVVGRLSNLYGPRTNPGKGQGLVPSLCRATVHRTPLNLYVSMDTIRDYLFAEDAGQLVWASITGRIGGDVGRPTIEVLASGEATTVARAIATVQSVAHRKVPLALGTHQSARHQVIDLRLVPTRGLEANRSLTSLASGVKQVLDSIVSEPM